METGEQKKNIVREKYSEIAQQDKHTNESSCCGSGCCSNEVYNIMSDDYSTLDGYNPDADLGLGCGLPTQFAKITKGDIVVDLGSGAGNDCFVARAETGESGKVIGVDFTPVMIQKARVNADKLKFRNVEFRLGDIEDIPVDSESADVVISNCVLNLVPNKLQAFKEVFRILKPGGHFSISDVVTVGDIPTSIRSSAEFYVGCIAGAIQKDVYLEIIGLNGFHNITIQKEKIIALPDDILVSNFTDAEINAFRNSGAGIFSVTVYGEKPSAACCDSNCCK